MRVFGINLLILLVLLAIVEGAFRVLGYGYGNAAIDSDPSLHHAHPANYHFVSYAPSKEYGGHSVAFDGEGNRVNPWAAADTCAAPVWFFGDSFTEAAQVDWTTSFPALAAQAIDSGLVAVNMGVASYSPLLELIQLKKKLGDGSRRPVMAIIQLYSNDPKDDDEYAASAVFNDNDEPMLCYGGQPSRAVKWLRRSYAFRVARRAQLTMAYLRNRQEQPQAAATDLRVGNYVELAPGIADTSRFAKSVRQIDALLKKEGIAHWFVAMPSKYACLTGDWVAPTFSTKFNCWAEDNGLPFINLDPAFCSAARAGQKLFFDLDIHLNERGHALVAREIARAVGGGRQTAAAPNTVPPPLTSNRQPSTFHQF